MSDGSPSGRISWVWYALPVGALIYMAIGSRTPYFLLFRMLFTIVLVLLGALDWRSKGRRWLPILSWTVPFASLWLIAQAIVNRPVIVVVLVYWIGFAALLAMVASTRAARWWYETVLRQRFRG
jgi:hypothetical protein